MPRIRSIKPEFWTDEKVGRLSRDARLLFVGLWNLSDDYGVVKGTPRFVRSQLFGFDDDVTVDMVAQWIESLRQCSVITPISVSGECMYYIPGFPKHQVVNRPSQNRNCTESELKQALLTAKTVKAHGGLLPVLGDGIGEGDVLGGDKRKKSVAVKKSKPKSSDLSEAARDFAEFFRTLVPETQKVTPTDLRNWGIVYDQLTKIDGRDPAEIRRVSRWAREHSFWSRNFLSAVKLRNKDKDGVRYYDRFLTDMNSPANGTPGKTSNARPGRYSDDSWKGVDAAHAFDDW